MKYFIGIFYILHGFVHLLYAGHSLNYFELERGFVWPDKSMFLANIFSLQTKKLMAGVLCIITALSFVASGIFVLIGHSRHNLEVIVAVIMSTILFIVFWDGSTGKLHTQGGIALLINMLIIIYILY